MDYRSDLTGLRAIAVVAVMFYHFGVPAFGGGFAGVDVFFVISGYLMTRIIVGGLSSGNFSFSTFYLSRAKRIIPALAVVCLALLIFGLWYLGRRDFYLLSKHAVFSQLFVSNFAYRNEAGYFEPDAHEKWLLHTWSLSVEWQFYLLYPVVLAAVNRFWRADTRAFRGVLWLLTVISFAACVFTTWVKPVDAFFLLFQRAWELLAGGLVYVYSPILRGRLENRLIELAGLMLIAVSIVALSSVTPWPGYAAAIPVAGACLILLAAPKSFWADNPITQAIGKWSYSIYLWHWPLHVAVHYFDWEQTVWNSSFLILASVTLGYLSYRYVEEPCRHSTFASALTGRKVVLLAMPVVVLGIVGVATKGLPVRLPEMAVAIETDRAYIRGNPLALCSQVQSLHGQNACNVGDVSRPPEVAVLGDSHAGALMPAIKNVAKESDTSVLALLTGACPPIAGIQRIKGMPGNECKRYIQSSLALLNEIDSIRTVVLIARWSVYVEGYTEKSGGPFALFDELGGFQAKKQRHEYHSKLVDSLCSMAKSHEVYVVLPVPEQGKNIPRDMVRRLITDSGQAVPAISYADYAKRNAVVLGALDEASKNCNVRLLDPKPYLCGKTICPGVVGGRPIYYDDDHLNEFGSSLVAGMLHGVKEFGESSLANKMRR